MLQPLLMVPDQLFTVQGHGAEPSKQQCHGMAPCSQCAGFATVTSGCKWHINTGAAEEMAAIKQSACLDHLIGKQAVSVP